MGRFAAAAAATAAAAAAAGLLAAVPPAFAAPALTIDRVLVVGRVATGPWTDAPTEARTDQTAELAAIAIGHRGKQRVILVPTGVDALRLAGRSIPARELAALDATDIRWSTVEPHGFRNAAAQNGATSDFYSNVSTDPKTFGRWLGYDHIDYFEHVFAEHAAPIITAEIKPSEADAVQVPGLGTLRFKVDITLADGTQLASPGADATDTFGILPAVHRVSIRASDDFLGWLGAYLLVPEVFGSAGPGANHQTERFTGADCADVMVGAMRRAGHKLAYTNVAGLPAYTTTVARPVELDDHGMPASEIAGIKPGDLIRIDYGGVLRHHTPRDWDHVAALWQDRSDPKGPLKGAADGKLDGFDLVIHVGHPRLKIEPLAEQAPATIDVLRWRSQ
ncbi:MAG TPA: hypothetical protein VL326_16110 [Kofleriaceae bacterium]|nr:hypothetical protein [Kofleriaceae bacterium]